MTKENKTQKANDSQEALDNSVDAFILFNEESGNLVVAFGEDRSIMMEVKDDNEKEILSKIMVDANFWTSFLGSMSAALKQKDKHV